MRTRTLLLAVVCFSQPIADGGAADEESDAAGIEQLVADVQNVLPPGWVVEFKLVDPRIPTRRGSHPALVIKSDQPLPVEYFAPNPPGRSADEPEPPPDISLKTVAIHFVASPYLSSHSYSNARERNGTLVQRRVDFERNHLKHIRWSHMGPNPIPPDAFEPRTARENHLVRQYAYLWVSTQPQPLPTHHTDRLAFEMRDLGSIKLHDAKRSKEYKQILEAVQKFIVPYERGA